MSTTPARTRRPARVRAVVVAVLVLAFVIPWTYAHIAYAWPWKEQSTSDACTGKYYLTPYDKRRPIVLGTLSDGRTIYMGMTGKVSTGRKIGSFGLSARDDNKHYEPIGGAKDLHRGDSTTVDGVGTFTLKEAHSDIVWFTPNPGKATFCFDPDPAFTVRDEP
ncbi:DNA-binding protein [Pauljensenia sp. 20925_1_27]